MSKKSEDIGFFTGLFTGLIFLSWWFAIPSIIGLIWSISIADVNCTKDDGGSE